MNVHCERQEEEEEEEEEEEGRGEQRATIGTRDRLINHIITSHRSPPPASHRDFLVDRRMNDAKNNFPPSCINGFPNINLLYKKNPDRLKKYLNKKC